MSEPYISLGSIAAKHYDPEMHTSGLEEMRVETRALTQADFSTAVQTFLILDAED